MSKNTPRVSICMPTYNRSKLLRRAIEAVLHQTFQDLELIICDDASIDDTETVVRSYDDPRIRYHRNEHNLGIYENWNTGIELALGEYIAIYHDHDVYLPTIVQQSVALLDKYPSASFVHTALYMIDEDDQLVGIDIRPFKELTAGESLRRSIARGWFSPVMAATVMVRREAYEQVGSRYEHKRYGQGCDLNMWFRLAEVGDTAYVSTPQAYIRSRTKNEATAQFRWADVLGELRMREDHIQVTFRNDLLRQLLVKCQYAIAKDWRLSMLFTRSLLKEKAPVISEGWQIVNAGCSPMIRMLLFAIANSRMLQRLVERAILPIHYWRVERRKAMQKTQADTFQTMISSEL